MARIPTTVVTGFLGAEKTTLIRHLLQNAGGRRLVVVVNEFGEVGIDGEILSGCGVEGYADDDILELANGCICCTVADNLLPTLERLIDRENLPAHILIETSGLALPKPMVKAFAWPQVKTVADFMRQANLDALRENAERRLEALERGLWKPRSNSAAERLRQLCLETAR